MGQLSRTGADGLRVMLRHRHSQENHMPIILWLLGVPLTVVLLLMLFGVF